MTKHTVQAVAINGPLGTLRGMFHHPGGEHPAPAVMMLHGFTGNHIEDQFLFVQFARILANAGYAVLRFDFYGSGDSDGTFEDFTVNTEVADAVTGLDWLQARPDVDGERLGVLGLSMGGCVTALLAGQDARVKAAMLWNAVGLPVRHFGEYAGDSPHARDEGGLRVGPDFLAAFHAADPAGALTRYQGPGLVVQGTGDEVIFMAEAEALNAALGHRGTFELIHGADHTFRSPAWRADLFTCTLNWLATHLPADR